MKCAVKDARSETIITSIIIVRLMRFDVKIILSRNTITLYTVVVTYTNNTYFVCMLLLYTLNSKDKIRRQLFSYYSPHQFGWLSIIVKIIF